MTKSNTSIPSGYHTATPYLFVRDCAGAIEFYRNALGATEKLRMSLPDGKVGHAEIILGDSVIMLAEEAPSNGFPSPLSLNASGAAVFLYVPDMDILFNRAVENGASVILPVADLFYGDRVGTLKDPYGHVWSIATHKEDLTPTELSERTKKFNQQGKSE
ncbi:MAG: VOC family protein [Anaerolineales bacterium]|nr:VOC family protein [Anaerolineales bacterium]